VVDEAYRGGLVTTITQEYRTYGKVSREEIDKLDDLQYLKSIITGYTVDFLRSLRLSERAGVNPNTAIDIARLSYHYNPTKLIQLVRQYPDVNLSAVQAAALGYPKNPETFLDGFISNVARLTEDARYRALPQSVIDRAALSYPKNPEAFLDGFISNVARLTEDARYRALPQSVIDRAALGYPKNPETFLDGFISNVARLTEKYPNISKNIINVAALYFSGNSEAYIEKVKEGKPQAEISALELESMESLEDIGQTAAEEISFPEQPNGQILPLVEE
jgi:hypothetical protein